MMDDIIDLELEKIDVILGKIDADPESDEVKSTERNLWVNIRNKAEHGRRTGIGITAEGDMLAALGIKYGSEKGNAFSVEVHKTLAIETYRASIDAAKFCLSCFNTSISPAIFAVSNLNDSLSLSPSKTILPADAV